MSKKIEDVLARLSRSKFCNKFKLDEKDQEYISVRGMETVRKHARDFIVRRIAPASIKNDGKQTPVQGHPVFKAQHATGTCCRECLAKWHSIKAGRTLKDKEIKYIADVILAWIDKQISKKS